jgi:DNA-binding response OmpR family regulator
MSANSLAPNRDALGSGGEKRKNILCVDDHEDTRAMMSLLLGMFGYRVTTAASVTEALPLTKGGSFDLFILDGVYPDGLGVDLCRQIRAFDSQTPVLFLSGLARESDIANGMNAGAHAYLAKPIEVDKLKQTIMRLTCGHYARRAYERCLTT